MHLYSREHGIFVEIGEEGPAEVLLCEQAVRHSLSRQYFDILAYLMFKQGKWRTVDQIAQVVLGEATQKTRWIVQKGVEAIRSRIGDNKSDPRIILTKYRFGHMFDPGYVSGNLFADSDVVTAGDILYWPDARRAFVKEREGLRELDLQNNAMILFEHLVRNAGAMVRSERAIQIVWPQGKTAGQMHLREEVRFILEALKDPNGEILQRFYDTKQNGRLVGLKLKITRSE